jgi:tRNA (guanine10-N2)-methyltransferase
MHIDQVRAVRALGRRLTQILFALRSIYAFYAQGSNYGELHARIRANRALWSRYAADTSFRFLVSGYKRTLSQEYQRQIMESFDYMQFLGNIDMKNPEIILGCFEECMLVSFITHKMRQ